MNSRKKLLVTAFTSILISSAASFAIANSSSTFTHVHTWHTISAAQGVWEAKLAMLNEGGYFVNRQGQLASQFIVSRDRPFDYGFAFDKGDDFDVAYTLTLIQKPTVAAFVSKACVFVISASGPAKPDIQVSSYNGAKCDYKIIHGVGEDFIVG